jgi:flagellar FliL protein
VTKLIERFQPFIKTKIRLASDFDHGLKELFENRPSLVFIQAHIGNVSGETVARHIKSLLGTTSPKIILLGESEISTKTTTSLFDDWMPIVDSEQEFFDVFEGILQKYFPAYWAEISADKYKNDQSVTECVSEALSSGNKSLAVQSVLAEDAPSNDDETIPMSVDKVSGASIETGKECASPSKRGWIASDKQKFSDQEFSSQLDFAGQDFPGPPHDFRWKNKNRNRRLSLSILVTLLVLALGICLYRWVYRVNSGGGPEISSAGLTLKGGKDLASSLKPKIVFKGLPSFIRAEWRVPQFSTANPGWERYVSPDFDFRLFRETGAMKALQIIALGDTGVPDTFLSSILNDLGFTGPKKTEKPIAKDGFLVEKSVINGVVEIVIYRNETDNKIMAFVVAIN